MAQIDKLLLAPGLLTRIHRGSRSEAGSTARSSAGRLRRG